MSQDWIAAVVVALTFGCGMFGLFLRHWPPDNQMSDQTRDLINRVTGLVATMTALVLGLLIASANTFYNNQKSGLEVMSTRMLQLDGVLHHYGPEAKPVRDAIKQGAIEGYERIWVRGKKAPPSLAEGATNMDSLAVLLDRLVPATPEQKALLARAADIASSMADQRMLMTLQNSNTISWPFLIILTSWTSLMFFGFGLLARRNATTIATLAIGAFTMGSAVFLIVELSQPFSGVIRMSPAPLLQAIGALGT